MVKAMLQTLRKKSQKVGKKRKKALIPQGQAEQRSQAPAQRPWSSRQQRVHTPHASPDAGWTLWKFKIPDGSFWVGFFFFFALPHFQGNKTPCHLPVAIEISPDSASAEEKAGLLAAAEEPRAATAFKLTGKSGDKWGFI